MSQIRHTRLVPEITLPFPSVISPFADDVETDVLEWADRCGITAEPWMRRRCAAEGWGHLAARGWPRYDRKSISLCAQWLAWELWIDDQRDEGNYGTAQAWQPVAYRLRRVYAAHQPPNGRSPMEIALADLCRRTYALPAATAPWRRRFVADLDGLLKEGATAETVRRDRGAAPSVDEYVRLRRLTGGMMPLFDLTEVIEGVALPEALAHSDTYRDLRFLASDVINWINDLYSLPKEAAGGESSNMVLLHQMSEDLSLPDAVHATMDLISRQVAEHQRLGGELAELLTRLGAPERVRAGTLSCVEVTRTWMASVPVWSSRETLRYPEEVVAGAPQHGSLPDLCAPVGEIPLLPTGTPHGSEHEPVLAGLPSGGGQPVRVRIDGREVWATTTYADTVRVLSDPLFSRQAAWGGSSVIQPANILPSESFVNLDAPDHKRLRRFLAAGFGPRRIATLQEQTTRLVDSLLDALEERAEPPADLLADFTVPLSLGVVSSHLGVSAEDNEEILTWLPVIMSGGEFSPQEAAAAIDRAMAYIRGLLADKHARPESGGFFAELAKSQLADDITEAEFASSALALLVAGYVTTGAVLANAMVLLFRHPEQLRRMRERPELIPAGVEEILRHSRFIPAGAFSRVATADTVLNGVTIAAGETVVPMTDWADRDPTVFADADTLDIGREHDAPHLGFGFGPHYCIGAHIARLQLHIGLAALLARFPALRLAVPENDLTWVDNPAIRSPASLPVTW
ncbi:cytochrome P450 [Streptomyces celluloflavus]|uniref:cytochrome P450 n=1 Tax=Streptomyces celluloflavus TaxID=58344 RepID=UPI0036CF2179